MLRSEGAAVVGAAQHVNYALRGHRLNHMCLYEYVALITVVKQDEKTKAGAATGSKAGRKQNESFRFDSTHPLYHTHTQRLNSKIRIPVLAGFSPPRFPFAPVTQTAETAETASSKTKRRRKMLAHARYMYALFVPWREGQADPVTSRNVINRYAQHLRSWRVSASADERVKYWVCQNIAEGMRCDEETRKTLNSWCFSCTETATYSEIAADLELAPADIAAVLETVEQLRASNEAESAHTIALQELFGSFDFDLPQNQAAPRAAPVIRNDGAETSRQVSEIRREEENKQRSYSHHTDDLNPFVLPQRAPGVSVSEWSWEPGQTHPLITGLNDEQKAVAGKVLCAIFGDEAERNIIIYGGPGVGKSVTARALLAQANQLQPRSLLPMASTGIAGVNIGGRTWHSGLRCSSFQPSD